ncbi:S-adenosyl-L-methionine-dependent methyltransferase [Aspergillus japonicus CBS 114.51]|uniref:S-adenosyl-L-methionine-dependent methyltransferase n=1 Tax=Aspergillus japonicus CBS 114.51 TaxID=1448312 RepID=A0A8T8WS13_ASPJA|nr:S-adenosyl-L-methionine-dependent methyltransferase [Aspergillus japonicus CBS 114.51]RAH78645.1 S-adenosyl-L-methionine-dependent methyltransferase [Aspergillus japonicus CBS 114.51]
MTRRIFEELVDSIAENGEILKQQVCCETNSLLGSCLADLCRMDEETSKARLAVIDASKRLIRLVTGPYDLFYDMMSEVFQVGVICEVEPEMFGHTPLLVLCVYDPVATRSCMWNLNIIFPVASKIYEGLKVDPTASDNTRCAASLELGFQDYVKATTRSVYYSSLHTVRGFNWSSIQTVVDIGGSSGHVSMALAEAHPHLHCIVEDLPDVISGGRETLPPTYADKIEYLAHSFFEPQPVATADCFLLRFILHNWSDEDVCRIIANLSQIYRSLCGPASIVRYMDCRMLALFGGHERTKNDIVALVQGVDRRLVWESCTQPEGSVASFLALQCI